MLDAPADGFGTRRRTRLFDDLLALFAKALGLPSNPFVELASRPTWTMNINHYPPVSVVGEPEPGQFRIGPHTDFGTVTILDREPGAGGLQVYSEDGGWEDAPYDPDALTVNIGDLLEIWTNGEFVATSHRVRKVAQERYSFPLFVNVDADTVVAPLESFRGNGPIKPTVVAGEHLFAQTAQSFRYLQDRVARGEVTMPEGAQPLDSFGRDALLHR